MHATTITTESIGVSSLETPKTKHSNPSRLRWPFLIHEPEKMSDKTDEHESEIGIKTILEILNPTTCGTLKLTP